MKETYGLTTCEKNILVVDDDPTILSLISRLLKDRFNLLLAQDGDEALQQESRFEHDLHLLLTDFQMEGMNGVELATQVTVKRPKTKVLIMSGNQPSMLVSNEGWRFIAKPFTASELLKVVADLTYRQL
jgi:two-component system cell cycle sensor histidine kinase PleC